MAALIASRTARLSSCAAPVRLASSARLASSRHFATSRIWSASAEPSSSGPNTPPSSLSSSSSSPQNKDTTSAGSKESPKPSSSGPKESGKGSVRLPLRATLYVLLTSSVVLTGLGVYEFYNSFQTWPKELREDLRAAVKFRRDGEWKGAELKFRSALATAQRLDPKLLEPSLLLKVTGIWISLASMFEDSNQIDKAYNAYNEGFKMCLTDTATQSVEGRPGQERARAVAMSQKLGELALKIADLGPDSAAAAQAKARAQSGTPAERVLKGMGRQDEKQQSVTGVDEGDEIPEPIPFETRKAAANAAEKHLVWSVEELLRLTVPSEVQRQAAEVSASAGGTTDSSSPSSVSLAELDLPPWVTQTDLLSSLESLGAFYARAGKTEYAVPLFLQALEFLIPTNAAARAAKPPSSVTVSDRCKASVIMNNLSQVFLEGGDVQESAEFKKAQDAHGGKIGQSTAWAKKGLDLVQSTNTKAGWGLTEGAGASKQLVGSDDTARTEQVKQECIFSEIALLINLGTLSQMADDKCAARNYLQRAYRLANQEGYREARIRAASILSSLERR